MHKALPFTVDHESPVPLSGQIAAGIAAAIRTGYYGSGDRLPNLAAMASDLGVGLHTVRGAVLRLAEQGEIAVRRRSGIRVVQGGRHLFTRHVVHVDFGGLGYYFTAKSARLRERLTRARIRVSAVPMGGAEFAAGMPSLTTVLDGNSVDLIVVDGPVAGLLDLLAARQTPWVAAGDHGMQPEAVASVLLDDGEAWARAAAHARACGAWRVAVLGMPSTDRELWQARFGRGGAEVAVWVAPERSGVWPEDAERAGWEVTRHFLAQTPALPDLLVFTDDYLARGGLHALAHAGVVAPRDVQLISHVNRGFRPAYPCELTRVEFDPFAHAEVLADLVEAVLREPEPPRLVRIAPRFVAGETTRPLPAVSEEVAP